MPERLSITSRPPPHLTFAGPSGTIAAATTDTGRSNSAPRPASVTVPLVSSWRKRTPPPRVGSSLPRAEPFTFSVPLMPSARPRIGRSPTPRNVQRRPSKLRPSPLPRPESAIWPNGESKLRRPLKDELT